MIGMASESHDGPQDEEGAWTQVAVGRLVEMPDQPPSSQPLPASIFESIKAGRGRFSEHRLYSSPSSTLTGIVSIACTYCEAPSHDATFC